MSKKKKKSRRLCMPKTFSKQSLVDSKYTFISYSKLRDNNMQSMTKSMSLRKISQVPINLSRCPVESQTKIKQSKKKIKNILPKKINITANRRKKRLLSKSGNRIFTPDKSSTKAMKTTKTDYSRLFGCTALENATLGIPETLTQYLNKFNETTKK